MYCVSPSVWIPVTGRRVACAFGLTMERCWPTSAFRRLDFPTLGAPARAMWPVLMGMEEDRPGSRTDVTARGGLWLFQLAVTGVHVESGLYCSIARKRSSVLGPKSCSYTTPSWLTIKVFTPVTRYSAGAAIRA